MALDILARRPMSLEDLRRELAKEAIFTDVVTVQTNAIERLRRLQAMVLDADPARAHATRGGRGSGGTR